VLQGNGPTAQDELQRADDPSVWDAVGRQQRPAQEVDDLFIGRLRVDLHFGDAKSAVTRIDAEWRRAMASERRYRTLKLRLLLAMAFYRGGDRGRAMDEMTVALQEACREGFVRLVLDEGAAMAPPLRRVLAEWEARPSASDPILLAYAQGLSDQFGPPAFEEEAAVSGGTAETLAEQLTAKEVRVLQLLAEGYSNSAMAEKLFLSDSTVRTHLRNINTKLNSRSRTQAVAIARRLGVTR
jgi:LuxR family maltose regulon positive regulatory protein